MHKCKFCESKNVISIIDLGYQPPCNQYIPFNNYITHEKYFPLELYICENCSLVQVSHNIEPSEIFSNYSYFSSFSSSWLEHAKNFSNDIIKSQNLSEKSFVVEIASNDGYLLKNFNEKKIPCLGIEPARNIAEKAKSEGINTLNDFFSEKVASEILEKYKLADLIIANNVLAHVPNINDFLRGVKILLAPNGIFSVEVPYLKDLVEKTEFDTIYHEHFFYYSISSLTKLLEYNNLLLSDVKKLKTHGGSVRLSIKHKKNSKDQISDNVREIINIEENIGISEVQYFNKFRENVQNLKLELLNKIIELKLTGKTIAGYGAPGKGNTLLNYCGIKSDLIEYTVDRNPEKQHTFLPGSRIPVYPVEKIKETRPDYILILPWNLKDEIITDLQFVKEWNAKFIIPIPKLEII